MEVHPIIRQIIGLLAIGFGIFVAGWAVITIADMDIAAPTGIITTGPYAFSRNPMYTSWTFISLGISFIINNIWILFFIVLAVLYTHKYVILKEEHYLEEHFGDQYRNYKNNVRRYV